MESKQMKTIYALFALLALSFVSPVKAAPGDSLHPIFFGQWCGGDSYNGERSYSSRDIGEQCTDETLVIDRYAFETEKTSCYISSVNKTKEVWAAATKPTKDDMIPVTVVSLKCNPSWRLKNNPNWNTEWTEQWKIGYSKGTLYLWKSKHPFRDE
jgi:hypothetical protein